jgi:signal transduction histidine kinase
VFSVSDTGPGIAEEDRAKLFAAFWQAEPMKSHGLGLGLAIAKGIVDAHAGRIWAESPAGAGATVGFSIPANARPDDPRAS